VILILLGVWEITARLNLLSLFFPAPSTIIVALVQMVRDNTVLANVWISLQRLGIGFVLGCVPATLIGLGMGASPTIRRWMSPIISALHPIPRIALFPLFIIMLGIGEYSKIMVVATGAFFPMLYNAMSGILQIPLPYIEAGRSYGLSRWQIALHIMLRGSLPSLLTGFRLSLNRGMVMVIAVEMLTTGNGLGSLIDRAWRTMRIDELYATLALIGLVGLGLESTVILLERRLIAWNTKD